MNIAKIKIDKKYLLDKPKGEGRSSDNSFIKEKIGWDTKISLKGVKKTYEWIYKEITSKPNNNKFTKKIINCNIYQGSINSKGFFERY